MRAVMPDRPLTTIAPGSTVVQIGTIQVFRSIHGCAVLRLDGYYDGHPAAVLDKADLPKLIQTLTVLHDMLPDKPDTVSPQVHELLVRDGPAWNGLCCPACGNPQFDTPSGATCSNGHGGELGEPMPAVAEEVWEF